MTSAFIRAITAVLALAAALAVPAARAAPAEPQPYLVEYRAYNAALESGDMETAATHGLAAWKAAEQALGDHRLTGVLAYNYGQLVIFSATDEAATPLRRASELQQAGVAELPLNNLRLYLGYAEFVASGFEEDAADDLREALNAVGLEDEALIHQVAPMWLALAAEDFAAGEYRKAIKSAAKAEAAIPLANPEASRELAQAILLGTVANLVRRSRDIDDVEAANEQFGRARRLFPPQKDLDSFDPLLAQVIAWHHVSWDLLRAMHEVEGRRPPDGEDDDSPPAPPYFQYQADGSLECSDLEWLERQAPDYPRGALRDGYLGAVALGYRLGEDLTVKDARVLAEVPAGERFGQASLDALSEWRPKSLPTGGSACSYVTVIRFVIDY